MLISILENWMPDNMDIHPHIQYKVGDSLTGEKVRNDRNDRKYSKGQRFKNSLLLKNSGHAHENI